MSCNCKWSIPGMDRAALFGSTLFSRLVTKEWQFFKNMYLFTLSCVSFALPVPRVFEHFYRAGRGIRARMVLYGAGHWAACFPRWAVWPLAIPGLYMNSDTTNPTSLMMSLSAACVLVRSGDVCTLLDKKLAHCSNT